MACLALPLLLTHTVANAQLKGKNIAGAGYRPDFHLTDDNGLERTLKDYRGKVVVMFFGYTRCPDVCPTTLTNLAEVMKLLGPDASKIQVLFVTIDPDRDTQELLHNYVPAFNPAFHGLRGTEAQTEQVTKAFKVAYKIIEYNGQYLVDHSASGYIIDRRGKARVLLPYHLTAQDIASDVRTILAEK